MIIVSTHTKINMLVSLFNEMNFRQIGFGLVDSGLMAFGLVAFGLTSVNAVEHLLTD